MSSLIHSVLFLIAEDIGATSHSEGLLLWLDSEETLQRVTLALVFTLSCIFGDEILNGSVLTFLVCVLFLHAHLGALMELKWPGSNVYATSTRSELVTVPGLTAIFTSASFIPIIRIIVFHGVSQLYTMLQVSRTLIHSTTPQIIRFIHLLCFGARVLSAQFVQLTRAVTELSSQTLTTTLEFGSRSLSGCSKTITTVGLKLGKSLLVLGKHAAGIMWTAAGFVYQQASLAPHFFVLFLKGCIHVAVLIVFGSAIYLHELFLEASVLFSWPIELLATFPELAFHMFDIVLDLGLRITLGCSKAIARIYTMTTSLKLSERLSTLGVKVVNILWTSADNVSRQASLFLCLSASAVSSFVRFCKYTILVIKYAMATTLLKATLVIGRRASNSLQVLMSVTAWFSGFRKHVSFIVEYTATIMTRTSVEFVPSCVSLCRRILVLAFTGLSGLPASLRPWSVERIGTFASLSQTLSGGFSARAMQVYKTAVYVVHSFKPSISTSHKGIIMWKAFRVNLVYIFWILASYFVLLSALRYISEQNISRLSTELADNTENQPILAQHRVSTQLEGGSSNSVDAQPIDVDKTRRGYAIAAQCAAAAASNFIACSGLRRLAAESCDLHAAQISELKLEVHTLEKKNQEKELDARTRTETNGKPRMSPSYTYDVIRGLEAARLELERGSAHLEDAARTWAVEQTRHSAGLVRHRMTYRCTYSGLYEGDLDLSDFLGFPRLSEGTRAASLLPPSSSTCPPEGSKEMHVLRQALIADLHALENAAEHDFGSDFDKLDHEMSFDFESLPQSMLPGVLQKCCVKRRQNRTRNVRVREELVKMGATLLAL